MVRRIGAATMLVPPPASRVSGVCGSASKPSKPVAPNGSSCQNERNAFKAQAFRNLAAAPPSPDMKSTTKLESASIDRAGANLLPSKKKQEFRSSRPGCAFPKPWEIKAQAKAERDRLEMVRKREAEAQLRMQKIKDEINAIKRKEEADRMKEEADRMKEEDHATGDGTNKTVVATDSMPASIGQLQISAEQEGASQRKVALQAEDPYLEMEQGLSGNTARKDEDEASRAGCGLQRELGRRMVGEMMASFTMLENAPFDQHNRPMSPASSPSSPVRRLISQDALQVPPELPRQHKPVVSSASQQFKEASPRSVLNYVPSNGVPQMMPQATHGGMQSESDRPSLLTPSTHSSVVAESASYGVIEEDEEHQASNAAADSGFPSVSSIRSTWAERCCQSPSPSRNPNPTGNKTNNVKSISQKQQQEKVNRGAEKQKLDEAKSHFDEGHDLCWKFQDSASALVQYRKALFLRESLLGKYHEDTGRTYFWMAQSFVKLKEFDEALVAFSRALRIFERVLSKSHKYNKWTIAAIESVFREMKDVDTKDFGEYKASLDTSIAHERTGDQCHKRGRLEEAIAQYRLAIENLDQHHPDSADLYCKIAVILRKQGEFDRALEEYLFASKVYELSLGADHPETIETLNKLVEKKRGARCQWH